MLEFSPSRTYIAICNDANGHSLKEFVLPVALPIVGHEHHEGRGDWVMGSRTPIYQNNCAEATKYFQKAFKEIVVACVPLEQRTNIKPKYDVEPDPFPQRDRIIQLESQLAAAEKVLQPFVHKAKNDYNKWTATRHKDTTLNYIQAMELLAKT